MFKCSHCQRIFDMEDMKIRKYEYSAVSGKYRGRTVLSTYKCEQGLCPECHKKLTRIDRNFIIAYVVIDIIIAIVSYILYLKGFIKDGMIIVPPILMAAVPWLGNDFLKLVYIEIEQYITVRKYKKSGEI